MIAGPVYQRLRSGETPRQRRRGPVAGSEEAKPTRAYQAGYHHGGTWEALP